MKKLLPILLAILGVAGGLGAGVLFKPAPSEIVEINPCEKPGTDHANVVDAESPDQPTGLDYVKLNNQFVIPIIRKGNVASLVVLSLSLEVSTGGSETVYKKEPKLRDAFLQTLFEHASAGGFDGDFTNGNSMRLLRDALLEIARRTLGAIVSDVLIMDLVRQDN
ncbi:flagellar basal body-associated FliL family protein [Pseudogemmobacter sp. W21_MBD1_M6]|uniref:flagellar basal body-associated FliL family protein n=1 Tax=Pseudogemmobacter sp. W21_MBD1_M6 TaxID=3240271 RepID=UPI003F9C79D1